MRVSFLFAWYDLWVGFFWDKKNRWLYILPLPMLGVVLKFGKKIDPKKAVLLNAHTPVGQRVYWTNLLDEVKEGVIESRTQGGATKVLMDNGEIVTVITW